MIDIARQLGRLTVERVARQADDAEQARRVLAGARAIGLRQSWVRSVLAGQIAWVVLAPTAAGVVGSALGVLAVTTLQGMPMDLHIPWAIVGTMAAGTLLAFVGAVWLALRNLTVRERLG